MTYLKRIVIALIIIASLIVISNEEYFSKEFNYYLNPPQQQTINTDSTKEDGTNRVQPNMIWVWSLDINAPITYVEEVDEELFQNALQNGVVHYPKTAPPGQNGNVYIFGHSSDFAFAKGNYKTVFALLPKVEIGAEIGISDAEGKLYRYKVEKKFSTSPRDLEVLKQDYTKKQLTLQTSYPIGTALRRYIVVAYLIE
ncbi:MAG TPA: sortase [Candidatus Binatia bacterium]|nr:sortase [Candidatus Binatia bacterium]